MSCTCALHVTAKAVRDRGSCLRDVECYIFAKLGVTRTFVFDKRHSV